LLSDTVLLVRAIVVFDRVVSSFAKIGVSVLASVYLARGFANSVFVPSSIAYIVDGVRGVNGGSIQLGVLLPVASAAIFVVTEVAHMVFFKKLTKSIVSLKQFIVIVVKRDGVKDDAEDLLERSLAMLTSWRGMRA